MIPNPGSDEARAQGCLCPILDNGRGLGRGVHPESGLALFVFSLECPLHGEGDWLDRNEATYSEVQQEKHGNNES